MNYQDSDFSPLDATVIAENRFYDAVDNPYFRDRDVDVIYRLLQERMTLQSFSFYLKRYIYQKTGLREPFEEVSEKTYQSVILESFADTGTPYSFEPVSTKPGAITKNWLRQKTVNRGVVLLLGFGLAMTADEVNEFLIKALKETGLSAKDPREAICLYCYQRRLPYAKYYQLWNSFSSLPLQAPDGLEESAETATFLSRLSGVRDEEELMRYLQSLRSPAGVSRHSVSARRAFNRLYAEARALTADLFSAAEEEDNRVLVSRLRERLNRDDRLYEETRRLRVEHLTEQRKKFLPEDITPADIEKVICAAVPEGLHGNLLPVKASTLNEQFAGKRFSRQRITELLADRATVDRFDLITLIFFIYSQKLDQYPRAQTRYSAFIDESNYTLNRCGMGPLYIANPYECFLLMCILTDDPLGTYADVWELSYRAEEDAGR